jgi:hypothetical protein
MNEKIFIEELKQIKYREKILNFEIEMQKFKIEFKHCNYRRCKGV